MKRHYFWKLCFSLKSASLLFLFTFLSIGSFAQIAITEIRIDEGDILTVELLNTSDDTVDVSKYQLCDFPEYKEFDDPDLNIECGEFILAPGARIALSGFSAQNGATDSEMGIYRDGNYTSAQSIVDYVEWGSTGHQRSSVAVEAGVWTAGDFVPSFAIGQSISVNGNGNMAGDWTINESPTICVMEMDTCRLNSSEISFRDGGGRDMTICSGDGVFDSLFVNVFSTSAEFADSSIWVITDLDGNIIATPPTPEVANFEGAGEGFCLIWYLTFTGDISGVEVGKNRTDITGDCFAWSNQISVFRFGVNGGTIALRDGGGTETTICAGDGAFDSVFVDLDSAKGNSMFWVVTDEEGTILALPSSPEVVGFEGAGAGVCYIRNLSVIDAPKFTGLTVGGNISEVSTFCMDWSNAIRVNRIGIDGGAIALRDGGTEVEICVGDGIFDSIFVTLDSTDADTTIWVITDEDGMVLGLPPSPELAGFEGAGPGICYIRNLSVRGEISGLTGGGNISDVAGDCFAWSNAIRVTRTGIAGGIIALRDGGGTEVAICAGDGIFDSIFVSLDSTDADTTIWVITDEDGMVLGLPPSPELAGFEGAGPGICYIRNLSVRGEISGLVANGNIEDITGDCFAWSNAIRVIRTGISGGTIALRDGGGTELTICAGDGIFDSIFVTLDSTDADTTIWVITDEDGMVLGLPPSPEFAGFEGAGPGICYIRNLSVRGEISGLVANGNIADITGDCFAWSNAIRVTRNGVSGGWISLTEGGGTEVTICVGDSIFDSIFVNRANAIGDTMIWVITDPDGNVMGLPPSPEFAGFEGAGVGECYIRSLSVVGEFSGLTGDGNISDVIGDCIAWSNEIRVNRVGGDDCSTICNASGGTVWLRDGGKDIKICVGDGEFDSVFVEVGANLGDTSIWIITDDQGTIIGLPPSIEVANLEGAEAGVCLVWNLSYFDTISGVELDSNIADIMGTCWDLSDSVVINRLSGDDCDQISSIVDNLDGVINVRAYPNPVFSQLNVELNFTERVNQASLRLYNYLGQALIVRDISGLQGERLEELEVGNLPAGAYILGVHTNKGSFIQNIIVAE